MQIGIFHVRTTGRAGVLGYTYARAAVRSARAVMPAVPIVHFTDGDSPPLEGVDAVRRKPWEPLALLRMRHQAGVPGEWLFVDTDVIFQLPIQRVFRRAFDIAIPTRTWPHLKAAVGFSERMPYNTGVVFSRRPAFWQDVYTRLRERPRADQEWMGDQAVICELLVDEDGWRRYRVAQIKGHKYNYPPLVDRGRVAAHAAILESEAAIVHYKGEGRKALLLERARRWGIPCA